MAAGRRAGQGVLEYLLVLGVILVGLLLFSGRLRGAVDRMIHRDAQVITRASKLLREQTGLEPIVEPGEGEEEEPEEPTVIAGLPPGGGAAGPAAGSGATGIEWGGGGGGSVVSPPARPGGVSGPVAPAIFSPPAARSPDLVVESPSAGEQARIDAAKALLLASSVAFTLFDFAQGRLVTLAVSAVIQGLSEHGVQFIVGNLSDASHALAAVFSITHPQDGTFNADFPVFLGFDRAFLDRATTEVLAAVMAHEAWHVQQLYRGIADDVARYPRTVDIEYEAFVVESAVWNAHKGSQTDRNLDAGAVCVAAGEARCKEFLASDFGYLTCLRSDPSCHA